MNKAKVIKEMEKLKASVDEAFKELNSDSPRKIYVDERVKHLKSQVELIEKLVGINEKKYDCCICGKTFSGYGNNAAPLKIGEKCCDECNKLVIEERIKQFWERR